MAKSDENRFHYKSFFGIYRQDNGIGLREIKTAFLYLELCC